MSSLHELSAVKLVEARAAGELSATELVSHFLERIERLNPDTNALVTRTPELALEAAKAMDEGIRAPGLLWGIPFADKDLVNRAGVATGGGSQALRGAAVPETSDPLALVLDEAGGISVGKSAVCEFGLTSYTESEVFPPTVNPFSPHHGSGGSSGGAAAAVASGMVPFSPGSDGGGSVRIPAWACGLVGHKPSRGLIPAGAGFDSLGGLVVPGPLARSVEDAALLLDALCGSAPTFRATGQPPRLHSFREQLTAASGPLTIGMTSVSPWDDWLNITVDSEACDAMYRVAALAEEAGHTVVPWQWKPMAGYAEAFYTLWQASAASLENDLVSQDLVESLTRYLMERGRELGARDLVHALGVLSRFETDTIRAFSRFDVVLTPGLATGPPPIGFYDKNDPEENFRQQVRVTPFSSFVNVCGLPALALPAGQNTEGLPVGVHLIGGPGQDALVLRLANVLEAHIGWVGTRPGIW